MSNITSAQCFSKKEKKYYFFLSLTSSITRSWQVVFGKHQILNTCCQRLFLSASSHQLCSQILKKKERESHKWKKQLRHYQSRCFFFVPGWKLSGAQQYRHELTKAAIPRGAEILWRTHLRDVPHSYCASREEEVKAGRSKRSQAWRGEVWGCQAVPGGEENGPQQEKLSDRAGQVKGLYCGRRPQVWEPKKRLPFVSFTDLAGLAT